jgi:hypothetical protein
VCTLVLNLCISEFILNKSLLCIINKAIDNMYCEAKGDICKVLKYSLRESLGVLPIVILIIFLKLKYIDILCGISPKISPYVNTE